MVQPDQPLKLDMAELERLLDDLSEVSKTKGFGWHLRLVGQNPCFEEYVDQSTEAGNKLSHIVERHPTVFTSLALIVAAESKKSTNDSLTENKLRDIATTNLREEVSQIKDIVRNIQEKIGGHTETTHSLRTQNEALLEQNRNLKSEVDRLQAENKKLQVEKYENRKKARERDARLRELLN